MSLFGSPPERSKQTSSGLFTDEDDPPPAKPSPGLFADEVPSDEEDEGATSKHISKEAVPSSRDRDNEQHEDEPPTMNKSTFSDPDSDPWASPAHLQRHQQRPNGDDDGPQRTTSTFTSSGDTHVEDVTSGGFGEDGPGHSDQHPQINRTLRRGVSQGAQEMLTVTALPEKEGMFLFQYRNYEVASSRKNTKVIRRYSDFVWLLDCLQKRYPFRQLPLLPPKRVSINGNYLAADSLFIEKRRRGLTRFANSLIRHPVLREEQLVTMFLTVPTELSAWRKQASITVVEEFTNRTLPPHLEDSLPPTLEDTFSTVRAGISHASDLYISLCQLFERLIKRNDGLASDFTRLSSILTSLTDPSISRDTHALDALNDVPILDAGLTATAKHTSKHANLVDRESRTWEDGVLEDLKRQRDSLVSMRNLFDRRDRLARDTIPALEKRIAANEAKLSAVRAKPEGMRRAGEAGKLEDAIMRDKEGIVGQHARGVFIKECVRDEIAVFGWESVGHVGRLWGEWAGELARGSEMVGGNWGALVQEVEGMAAGVGMGDDGGSGDGAGGR